MSRYRRGVLLVGLALVLGGLAATDVNRREAELDRRLAPLVNVVVADRDLAPGKPIAAAALRVRSVPRRWAPEGVAGAVEEVAGAAPSVRLPEGADIAFADLLDEAGPAAAVGRGERPVTVTAFGSAEAIRPGVRVDLLVTGATGTQPAQQDVQVLDARSAPADEQAAGERVTATLRVAFADALALADALASAQRIELLPRTAGDRGRIPTGAAG